MIKQHNLKSVYVDYINTHTHYSLIDTSIIENIATIKFILLGDKKYINYNELLNIDNETDILKSIKDTESYKRYLDYLRYIESLNYDDKTIMPIINNSHSPLYDIDKSRYKLINKQISYRDTSILQILKVLYSQHKVSRFDYKDSIKRINNSKPLKNKIKGFINCYLSTIKSNKSKNTLTALNRFNDNRNFEYINHLRNRYKVIVRVNYNLKLSVYSYFNNYDKIKLLNNEMIKEFKQRLINANRLMFSTITN